MRALSFNRTSIQVIIKLIFSILSISLVVIGATTGFAAYNDFQTDSAVTINISDLSHDYTLSSGGNVQSMTVGAGTVQVTMAASSKVGLVSTNRDSFSVSGQTSAIEAINYGCEAEQSSVQITFGSSDSTQTLTITPSTIKCTAAGSGGGSGGSGGSGGAGVGGGGASGAAATPATPATQAVPGVGLAVPAIQANKALIADAVQLTQFLGVSRNQSLEAQSESKVVTSARQFKVTLQAEDKAVLKNFVTYGVSAETQKLGSGERLALVRDQLETLGRVSTVALDQLARGQKPTERSLSKEQSQLPKVLKTFEVLVGKRPSFQNPKEDCAWNTLLYRTRYPRDLGKERDAIGKFKELYGKNPSSPFDWAVVRAKGYCLTP